MLSGYVCRPQNLNIAANYGFSNMLVREMSKRRISVICTDNIERVGELGEIVKGFFFSLFFFFPPVLCSLFPSSSWSC